MIFYVRKSDLDKAKKECDLGDSIKAEIFLYPHIDEISELVPCQVEYSPIKTTLQPTGWKYDK